MVVHKLCRDFDLREGFIDRDIVRTPPIMVASLLQVGTHRGAVEGDLTLLATALGADAPVYGEAETFFLAAIAQGAGHERFSLVMVAWGTKVHYGTSVGTAA
jgi:hypothetical protein